MDKRKRTKKEDRQDLHPLPFLTLPSMPRDNAAHYSVPGAFSSHTVSHMSCMTHTCAANSSHMYPCPYPTALSLIKRIDQAGDGWYSDCTDDLHLCSFIWFACMQATHCMSISRRQPQGGDQVLERLLEEGIFDCVEPNCQGHSTLSSQCVLRAPS